MRKFWKNLRKNLKVNLIIQTIEDWKGKISVVELKPGEKNNLGTLIASSEFYFFLYNKNFFLKQVNLDT